jgi:hypothetical protein
MAREKSKGCLGCLGNGCFWLFVVGLMVSAWGNSGPALRIAEALSLVGVVVAGIVVQWRRREAAFRDAPSDADPMHRDAPH